MTQVRDIRYIPAIDGLRAFAVIAVILYHLNLGWIPGGFLGVDLFFVISGYVITRLLLDSIQIRGGLDLRGFYLGRFRRLFPPLLFLVVSTLLFVGVWAPETIKRFLTDLTFVFTGTMNWWLVYRHQDYFESISRPPLLQHTWSLAVETQFYLVWPLILFFLFKKFSRSAIPKVALIIAAASGTALFLWSIKADYSSQTQLSHIYFGTDTHSIGLFLGSALAVSWIPQNLTTNIAKGAQNFIDGIGLFGLFGLMASFLFIHETDATLYRLAFPIAGIFGCALIVSLVHPASRVAPLMAHPAMVWIGRRSYAIYLWHWVIFQVTRPTTDLIGANWALFSLRILIVFALSDISYRWVELPARNGTIENWFIGLKYRTKAAQLRAKVSLCMVIVSLLTAITVISVGAVQKGEAINSTVAKSLIAAQEDVSVGADTSGLWVVGDSVILGIRYQLAQQQKIAIINARVGRQANELLAVLKADLTKMAKNPVLLDLGNNNILIESEVTQIFDLLKNQPRVVVVNTAVPRIWRDQNDNLIAQVAARYSNVKVVDWRSISQGHPEYFGPDGVHLLPEGVNAFVSAVVPYLPSTKSN
ncbi:MAG: acyltransferase family protein [Actinomycetes bacterium]